MKKLYLYRISAFDIPETAAPIVTPPVIPPIVIPPIIPPGPGETLYEVYLSKKGVYWNIYKTTEGKFHVTIPGAYGGPETYTWDIETMRLLLDMTDLKPAVPVNPPTPTIPQPTPIETIEGITIYLNTDQAYQFTYNGVLYVYTDLTSAERALAAMITPPITPADVLAFTYKNIPVYILTDGTYKFTVSGKLYQADSVNAVKLQIDQITWVPTAQVITVNTPVIPPYNLDGEGLITYKRGPNLGDQPLLIANPGITVRNCIFDDGNYQGGVNGAVFVKGNGVLESNTLINCARYGFTAVEGDGFKIIYNTVKQAQYGVSGSNPGPPSKNGWIQGNVIGNCLLDCIKIKNMIGCTFYGNQLDTYPGTNTANNKYGITFASMDSPNLNNIVESNTIFKSQAGSPWSCGIMAVADNPAWVSSGNVIRFNNINNCEFGIWIKGNNYQVLNNNVTNAANKDYKNEGQNNTFIPPIPLI